MSGKVPTSRPSMSDSGFVSELRYPTRPNKQTSEEMEMEEMGEKESNDPQSESPSLPFVPFSPSVESHTATSSTEFKAAYDGLRFGVPGGLPMLSNVQIKAAVELANGLAPGVNIAFGNFALDNDQYNIPVVLDEEDVAIEGAKQTETEAKPCDPEISAVLLALNNIQMGVGDQFNVKFTASGPEESVEGKWKSPLKTLAMGNAKIPHPSRKGSETPLGRQVNQQISQPGGRKQEGEKQGRKIEGRKEAEDEKHGDAKGRGKKSKK